MRPKPNARTGILPLHLLLLTLLMTACYSPAASVKRESSKWLPEKTAKKELRVSDQIKLATDVASVRQVDDAIYVVFDADIRALYRTHTKRWRVKSKDLSTDPSRNRKVYTRRGWKYSGSAKDDPEDVWISSSKEPSRTEGPISRELASSEIKSLIRDIDHRWLVIPEGGKLNHNVPDQGALYSFHTGGPNEAMVRVRNSRWIIVSQDPGEALRMDGAPEVDFMAAAREKQKSAQLYFNLYLGSSRKKNGVTVDVGLAKWNQITRRGLEMFFDNHTVPVDVLVEDSLSRVSLNRDDLDIRLERIDAPDPRALVDRYFLTEQAKETVVRFWPDGYVAEPGVVFRDSIRAMPGTYRLEVRHPEYVFSEYELDLTEATKFQLTADSAGNALRVRLVN